MQCKRTRWQTAADCARRTEQTYDPTVHDLYRRMRDAWIAVANRCEFLDDAVMPGSSDGERSRPSWASSADAFRRSKPTLLGLCRRVRWTAYRPLVGFALDVSGTS